MSSWLEAGSRVIQVNVHDHQEPHRKCALGATRWHYECNHWPALEAAGAKLAHCVSPESSSLRASA